MGLYSFDCFAHAGQSFDFVDNQVADFAVQLLQELLGDSFKGVCGAMGLGGFEGEVAAVFLVDVFQVKEN